MAKYDYRCEGCGHSFEAVQSMRDDPLKECPLCQGLVYRLISRNVGISFKGSGFHKNDYADKKPTESVTAPGAENKTPIPAVPAVEKKTDVATTKV